jgi:hypothetical protein
LHFHIAESGVVVKRFGVKPPPVSNIQYAFCMEAILTAIAILAILFFAKDGSSKRDKKD